MLCVGDRIRNYEILAQLRPGGMGTLYLGRRVGAAGFMQHVAIKLIHPHLSVESSFVSSFVNEALLGARIAHPNVVRVEELGEENGAYFLVMEYVHGCSLAELLNKLRKIKRKLTPELAVAIAVRAADGLHAAHETTDERGKSLGLVHRDVSPQNILLSVSGAVKLIDFGIAKAMAMDVATATGSLKGKIRYMSPEQAFGRAIDRRSDIYSLAIVLWEMLARRRMFKKGDDLAVLDVVRSPRIVPPSRYSPGLPPALDAALMQTLRIDPEARPATARELRKHLLAAVPGAHDVDGSQLAELIGEVMHDEIAANEEKLPSDARVLVPKKVAAPERTALTVTSEVSLERSFVEPISTALPTRSPAWKWIAGSALVAIIGVGAAWALSSFEAPREEPRLEATRRLEPPPSLPPPPIVEAIAPAPPPTLPAAPPVIKKAKKKRRVHKTTEAPKRVDGVPLLEDPGF